MTAVAIIPARGGSRRIPRKNIREFHGKPIIAYSIEAAKASGLFDQVAVSTDDTEIGAIAQQYGANVWARNPALAVDEVGTQAVMRAEIDKCYPLPDFVCCIYATAPMLQAEDLLAAYHLLDATPHYAYIDGWFYYGRTRAFVNKVPLVHGWRIPPPKDRWIDINAEEDWMKAERMYKELHP